MRFLNILLALLLTAGALKSQIANCDIFDIVTDIGDCTSDSTFKLGLNFQVDNPTSDSFEVWTQNNQFLGTFALTDLPIGIADFPTGNSGSSFVRICMQNNPNCCEIRQFLTPNCSTTPVCDITDITVQTGNCNPDGTYPVWINFAVVNPTDSLFEVWAGGGQYLGAFPLNQLPLQIPSFSGSGGATDELKVCINGNADCCAGISFDAPDCNAPPVDSCTIRNLRVRALDCTTDNSYALWLNFSTQNVSVPVFSVFDGNGQLIGVFNISQLPVVIPSFPWNGQSTDAVTVCLGQPSTANACCRTREFNVPDCMGAGCAIEDIKIDLGDCTSDSTFKLLLSFTIGNTLGLDSFELYAGNGQFLGMYGLNQLPLAIDSFPWGGEDIDYLKICIKDTAGVCCRIAEFNSPDCRPDACGTYNLRVTTGDCQDNGTFSLTLNFESALNTPIDSFAVYAANGDLIGYFSPADLPLTIPNYPWGGGFYDAVEVCVYYADTICCSRREFLPPDCASGPCDITNITIETGPCNNDGTYNLKLNFQAFNAAANTFNVWAGNGTFLGTFNLNDLPVSFPNFPWSGGTMDAVKICLNNGAVICCEIKTFDAPDCMGTGPCEIYDLVVDPGACNNNGTYSLTLNFQVQHPSNLLFEVWAGNGQYLGVFPLNQLPLTIPNFPAGGNDNDVIKVCINDSPNCCAILEFMAPDCPGGPCEIYDLVIDPGACTTDSTYNLFVNFQVQNPGGATYFGVWANGVFLDTFPLSALPLTIQDFPWDGGQHDVIKACLMGPNNDPYCCRTEEFQVPGCLNPPAPCEIYDLVLDPGACTSDSTYNLFVNFQVQNGGNATHFGVWANGVFLDTFPLSALPLTIQDFPWNGGQHDVIKVCLIGPNNDPYCCRTEEFQVPACLGPCEISNLHVDTGDCTSDSTYRVTIDFDVQNPGNTTLFGVWANGEFIGTFNLGDLPLTIDSFPWNGGQNDVVKVCLIVPGTNQTLCCKTLEFPVPACLNPPAPCEIYDLVVDPGACTSDSTYTLVVNFQVQNGGNATHFGVWANGVFLDTFPLSALPLTIQDFPWNGGQQDVIKVCLLGPNGDPYCCRTEDFQVPACLNPPAPCEIYDLVIDPGACTSDSTYNVFVNFQVQNGGNATHFGVWANGVFLDTFPLSALPLTIQDFPWNGGQNDVIKVCLIGPNNDPYCCRTEDFQVPACLNPPTPCDILNLHVETGDCTSDSTYEVWVNFQVQNGGGATHFGVWANNVFLGVYPLSPLPLYIDSFPWNGGFNDVIKVCLVNPNQQPYCCRSVEFPVPGCLNQGGPCEIYNLHVNTGDCTSDSTYVVTVDFDVQNPGNATHFGVWANGVFFNDYPLNALPLTIQNFPWNGGQNDVIKVCLIGPNGDPYCCRTLEFPVPACLNPGGPCEIFNLHVDTGDCTSDSTYVVTVDFDVQNPGNATHFGVWANGVFFNDYPLSALPLTIQNFPWNGGQNDVIKVCLIGPNGDPYCCRTQEFPVPGCLNPTPCDIVNLHVDTGNCTSDSTYEVTIDFDVQNPVNVGVFGVWANGEFLGVFNLNDLPLTIDSFPWNGGQNDVVKVCLLVPGTNQTLCCETLEFPVPACLGGDCHIYDLVVLHTPCLCGQFFAILTFKHSGGGNDGFKIVGNGNNYGNYPYDTQQPIILGPFDGDNMTNYEFAVVDLQDPDCFDDYNLGKVDCTMSAVQDPATNGKMTISPNPTTQWLQVSAQINGSSYLGQGDVDIIQPDGRLARTATVANAGQFTLDVSDLPAGLYRLLLKTASGRLDGTFVKQ